MRFPSRRFGVGCVALALAAPVSALADPVPAWVIIDEQTFDGVPLVLARDVVIADGGALRIRGSSLLVVAALSRMPSITVQSGGSLSLAPRTDPTTGWQTNAALRSIADPFDVTVEAGGSMTAVGAAISDARLHVGGGVELTDTVVDAAPLNVSGGNLTVTGGIVSSTEGTLVDASSSSSIKVTGATLRNASAALHVEDSLLSLAETTIEGIGWFPVELRHATATITDSTFLYSTEYAIQATDSHLEARRNTIGNHCGFVLSRTSGTISENEITGDGDGLSISGSDGLTIERNTFRGQSVGISAWDGLVDVSGNILEDNNVALAISGTAPSVSDNVFRGNATGVLAYDGAPTLRANSFTGNGVAVDNRQSESLDARGNWWGAPGGPGAPGADTFTGPVDASGWLDAPPG